MSLNINKVSVETQTPNFRGKYRVTNDGNPYYSTNSAAIAGGILAVPAFWHQYKLGKASSETLSLEAKLLETLGPKEKAELSTTFNVENYLNYIKKAAKKSKFNTVINALLASGLTLGCGLIVNKVRNKNARLAADEIGYKGSVQARSDNENIKTSEKGNLYYKSNDGKRIGALLGLGAGGTFLGVNALLNRQTLKESMNMAKQSIESLTSKMADSQELQSNFKKIFKGATGLTVAVLLAGFMLGGFVMGAISDAAANRKARKNA